MTRKNTYILRLKISEIRFRQLATLFYVGFPATQMAQDIGLDRSPKLK